MIERNNIIRLFSLIKENENFITDNTPATPEMLKEISEYCDNFDSSLIKENFSFKELENYFQKKHLEYYPSLKERMLGKMMLFYYERNPKTGEIVVITISDCNDTKKLMAIKNKKGTYDVHKIWRVKS